MIEQVAARRVVNIEDVIERIEAAMPVGPGHAASADVARFEVAMARPVDEVQAIQAAPPPEAPLAPGPAELHLAQATPAVEPAQQSGGADPWIITPPADQVPDVSIPGVGERVLDGMTNFRDAWSEAQSLIEQLGQRDLTPPELLSIQFQISHSTIMLSMVGQEVGTLSQKIDGLLKSG